MILGHGRQVGYFDRVILAGRLGHAYLLHGPERVGKRAVARAIAHALLCPQYYRGKTPIEAKPPAGGLASIGRSIADAGDDCRACREIDAGTHQDVVMVSIDNPLVPPKEKETRSEISIHDIRELKRRFSYAAVGDAWRIAIIDEVDTMSRDAEVAFLKLLEEPGARTLFFLIARSRGAAAPTIVSRATPMLFAPVPDAVLAPYVRTHLPKEPTADILAMARGKAGLVAEWIRNPERLVEDKKNALLFSKSFAGGIADMLALSERAADNDATRRSVRDAWIAHLRRHLAVADAAQRCRTAHRIARALDTAAIMDETNVNPRLALDAMFAEGAVK